MIVKPLAEEVTLASATDVNLASVVRLVNAGAATTVVVKDGDTTVASLTVAAGEVINIQKAPTNTLSTTPPSASVKVVKIAHTN